MEDLNLTDIVNKQKAVVCGFRFKKVFLGTKDQMLRDFMCGCIVMWSELHPAFQNDKHLSDFFNNISQLVDKFCSGWYSLTSCLQENPEREKLAEYLTLLVDDIIPESVRKE
jgi:hypothetical protein